MANFLFGTPYEYGLFDRVRYEIAYWICGKFGHKTTAGSGWATPDTGGEDFYCASCHDSWHIIYY